MGHHCWYDGSQGYPKNFRLEDTPESALINIVTCADCLDAATDAVGRSYNQGKDYDTFLEELKAGSGTRYAPWLVPLLEKEEVAAELRSILKISREKLYKETFELLRDMVTDPIG